MKNPDISFVVPAYNAAETLDKCLQSVVEQTSGNWEAVIVDDGSTDDTFAVATRLAERDGRIRVIRQDNGGASAARNTGVEAAQADYICMLDADDWIAADFLTHMLPVAMAGQGRVVAYCSYQRVSASGQHLPISWAPVLSGDKAMGRFLESCAIAIHAAVLPKAAYLGAGGMSTSLATCEDWELWVKVALSGFEFKRVDRCLAYYRLAEGTLTSNPVSLVRDTVKLTELVAPLRDEARRKLPAAIYSSFMPAEIVQIRMFAWAAAVSTSKGGDIEELAAFLPAIPYLNGYEDFIASIVFEGLLVGYAIETPSGLIDRLDEWEGRVDHLFSLLGSASAPGTSRSMWHALLLDVFAKTPPAAPMTVAGIAIHAIDADNMRTIPKPPDIDVCVVVFVRKGQVLATAVTPLWGDLSPRSLCHILLRTASIKTMVMPVKWTRFVGSGMREVIRQKRQFAKILLKKEFRTVRLKRVLRKTKFTALANSFAQAPDDNEAKARAIVSKLLAEHEHRIEHEVAGRNSERRHNVDLSAQSQEYWEEVFAEPDPWNYLSVYEEVKYQQTLDLIGDAKPENALEIACAEGIFTQKLCGRVGKLRAVDISERALERAAKRCEAFDNVSFGQLDLIKDEYPGGQDLIICSEVLYYLKDTEQLRQVARKLSDALNPGGILVTAHARQLSDDPNRTAFDWSSPFGIEGIIKTFDAADGISLETVYETELYSVASFRKGDVAEPTVVPAEYGRPLDRDVTRTIIWNGTKRRRSEAWEEETATRVPVLMYHRIADDAPEALRRYSTSPEAFREQLRLLRRYGFYSINSDTLVRHTNSLNPLKGRPVLITFDDAYRDFAEAAFPLLDENDFNADVFVVTDKVGGMSDWDAAYGAPAPLMDWDEIIALHGKGVSFGSHLASHTPTTALSSDELLLEAARSRAALQAHLGSEVKSIALPYGVSDRRVPLTLEMAGYDVAYTTQAGLASLTDDLLRVRRQEVYRDISLEAFGGLVGIV